MASFFCVHFQTPTNQTNQTKETKKAPDPWTGGFEVYFDLGSLFTRVYCSQRDALRTAFLVLLETALVPS